jgi:flavin-dependent dehydrogenase
VLRSSQATDVFIVGSGPAGLAAAIAARKKGFQVTVADGAAPPVEKPCGEGMMPETLAALADLGVVFAEDEGFRFRGISFIQDGARVSADFPHGRGLGLRRPVLHERLVRTAEECGVQLLWKTPVCAIDGESVRLPESTIHAKWIIGADGNASRVRRWSGLEPASSSALRFATRRHYQIKPWSTCMEIYWGRGTQGYVTPITSGEVCVVTMAKTAKGAAFDTALAELPELKTQLANARTNSRERGAVSAMRSLRHVQRGNIALLGDASGSVDAITGDGLRMAFRQALALADALAAGNLLLYQQAHREIAKRPIMMGNLMLWLSRHPHLRARVLRAMQEQPSLFARMVATHLGELAPKDFLSVGLQLGLRLLAI